MPALAIVITGCEVSRVPAPVSTRQLEVSSVKRIVVQPALSPAVFSPDGRRIAFSTERAVRVADLSGSSKDIARARGVRAMSWSRRLGVIAYVEEGAVWTMRDDGGGRARVRLPGSAVDVSWPRASDRLAVVLRRTVDGPRYELWLANREGGFRRLLVRSPVGRAIRDPQWFDDGLYLLYGLTASDSRLLEQAWRIRIAYPDRRKITLGTPAESLRLAPHGGRVAYVTGPALDNEYGRVIVSRLDGTGRVLITPQDGRFSGLVWSPQGDKLAFGEIFNGSNADIWVVDADGSGRLRIFSYAFELPGRNAVSIAWSPDGRHLIFGTNTGRSTGPLWLATLELR